jgi:hypothetical protein
MNTLTRLSEQIPGCVGAADNGDGTYRLDFEGLPSRLATDAEVLQGANSGLWAAQAKARKDREAKAALALPDSDDPVILRRKLNAALHIIQR